MADTPAPQTGPYSLPRLKFGYADLEPVIDEATMRLHHDKHHQTYIDGINAALKQHPQWLGHSVEDLLRRLAEIPAGLREAVRNQGGGHANHQFFWNVLTPRGSKLGGNLKTQIERDFGSVDAFKQQFEQAGQKHFGSGWVFLAWDPAAEKLEVLSLPNQDNPLSIGKSGLLLCDLWEHAYYLKYNNRRADWLKAWWDVVHWEYVAERFEAR